MKIDKYKVLKNDMYQISFNNNKYILHSNIILKNNLLLRSDITDSLLEKLEKENEKYVVYNIIIDKIGKKICCYKELYDFLVRKGYDKDNIKDSLDIAIKQGYLSDKTYAKSFVHDAILLSSHGPLYIRKQLEDNNINSKYIDEALLQYTKEVEEEKVNKLVTRMVKSNSNKSTLMLKKKILDSLYKEGFSKDIIDKYVESIEIDEDSSYQRTLEKVTRSLSRKYSGDELSKRIKMKMYSLGFTYKE